MSMTDQDAARYKAKMANRKAAQDAEVAAKTIEKGLLIVHTGKGKGKSTAAFGLLLRAIGRGFKCGVVQFGKGAWQSGERSAVEHFLSCLAADQPFLPLVSLQLGRDTQEILEAGKRAADSGQTMNLPL